MMSNQGFALLVGVDDYSSYDAAASLNGSREDVLLLYWLCTKLLGLAPESIRVLASPPLSPADFYGTEPPPPETLGPATGEAIQAGIQWLADRMASDGDAAGLFTFSGHGSYARGRGPLLCPTDVGRDLAKGIAVRDLSKMDALQKVRERLTVVLDCCHYGPEATAPDLRVRTALPHDATPEEVAADHADLDISERVLLAARPGQQAHQARLGEGFHGALTFALVTVAEQWEASQDPSSSGMRVSYKQLLKRVRRLLASLRMKQSTRLRVPSDKRKYVRELPFFGTHAAPTPRPPDAPRRLGQLTPEWFVSISNAKGQVVAQVIAMGSSSIRLPIRQGGTSGNLPDFDFQECWYVNTDLLKADMGGLLFISGARLVPSSSVVLDPNVHCSQKRGFPYPLYTCAEKVWGGWTQAISLSTPAYGPVPAYTDGVSQPSLYMQLNISGANLNSVNWYLSYPYGSPPYPVPTGFGVPGSTSANLVTGFPNGSTNYYAPSSLRLV